MFFMFFIFWLVLNDCITVETVIFGLVISAGMQIFVYRFMGRSIRDDVSLIRHLPYLLAYLCVLVVEIISSNNTMLQYLLIPDKQPEPAIIHFRSGLKSETSRMLLANSITLTPGTLTLDLTGDDFYVHCYDKCLGEGIEQSVFISLLKKMES